MAVTDKAIEKLKDMIVSGELRPGDRLPPEKELGERLGLSRNSLREAVKALALIRVLDVRQGDGTYVTSLKPDLLLEALSFVVDLHQDDSVLELLHVRRILEPAAVELAASRLDGATLERLHELVEAAEQARDVDELVAHDSEFHSVINQASGNEYLARLLAGMSSDTARARIWRGITQAQAVSRTIAEHRAIVEALGAGDADVARSWATVHVAGVELWVRRAAELSGTTRHRVAPSPSVSSQTSPMPDSTPE